MPQSLLSVFRDNVELWKIVNGKQQHLLNEIL